MPDYWTWTRITADEVQPGHQVAERRSDDPVRVTESRRVGDRLNLVGEDGRGLSCNDKAKLWRWMPGC